MTDSLIRKQAAIFEVVPDEDTISQAIPKIMRKNNEIL